eukprot:205806_1
MNRDFGTACSDLVLCVTSYVCSHLVYTYSNSYSSSSSGSPSSSSSSQSSYSKGGTKLYHITIDYSLEPAIKSLFYVQCAALIGVIRFALIPRGQLIVLGHNLLTVLGQQLSISLLGLSYFLLTFRSSSISRYFKNNFNEIFTSFERTLLIIIILGHLLNIQYVDKVIPILFGLIPIIITIIIAQNLNIFICGFMSLITMVFAITVLQQQNYRRNRFFKIRSVHWFHISSSISIYLHVITLINISNGGNTSFYDCFTLNFSTISTIN